MSANGRKQTVRVFIFQALERPLLMKADGQVLYSAANFCDMRTNTKNREEK
jgi:hypothetical protein